MPYALPSLPPSYRSEGSSSKLPAPKMSGAASMAMKAGLRERSKSSDSISTINVVPPTPDRYSSNHYASNRSIHPPRSNRQESHTATPLSLSNGANPPPRASTAILSPPIHASSESQPSSSSSFHHSNPVLAQVRSPPKQQFSTFENVPDSLQLNPRRGRRPRLFGFTEMSENGGGSGSSSQTGSAANSRESSPTNTPGALPDSPKVTMDALMFLPRKQHHLNGQWTPPAFDSQAEDSTASSSLPATPSTGSSLAPVETIPTPTHLRPLPPSRVIAPPLRSALSTRTAAQRNEGALKLNLEGIASKNGDGGPPTTESALDTPSVLIRKKSGEILKPSLKSSSSFASDYSEAYGPSTRSLPGTPSCPKYVHFDTQLEKVKLFLSDQKPRAVSRDGSPTHYASTSEGEEFPFPATDEDSDAPKRTQLEIRLPNFPTAPPLGSDCFLESLFLDEDRKSLKGIVQVKNLSFQKWVAIRFTYDWWQTTSEVTATHKESIRGGDADRFQFVLKLTDMISKIEEKTLFLALRYTADGREIWDSNGGSNYQVVFTKVPVVPKSKSGANAARQGASTIGAGQGRSIGGKSSQWSLAGQQQDRLADLRHKLNTLTADDASPTERLSGLKDKSGNANTNSPTRKAGAGGLGNWKYGNEEKGDAPPLSPLAGRYDFGSALSSLGKGSPRFNGDQELPGSTHRPSMDFYSPQLPTHDLPGHHSMRSMDTHFPSKAGKPPASHLSLPAPDLTIQSPSPPAISPPADYFNTKAPLAVDGPILTKAEVKEKSPLASRTALPRMYSLPSKVAKSDTKHVEQVPASMINSSWFNSPTSPEQYGVFGNRPHLYNTGSNGTNSNEASPPSFSSSVGSSSNSSDSSSPQQAQFGQWTPPRLTAEDVGKMDYSSFLQQFCWGGGAAMPFPQAQPQPGHPGGVDIRRVHSTSDVDKFYSQVGHTERPFPVTLSSDSIFSPSSSNAGTPTNATPVGSYFSKSITSGENLTPTNSTFLGSASSRSTITPSSSLPSGAYAAHQGHAMQSGSPLLDAVSRSLAAVSPMTSPPANQMRTCVA